MKKQNLLAFGVLIALTVATALISTTAQFSKPMAAALIMGLAVTKFLLVTFQFMELKHAHTAWKTAAILLCVFVLVGMVVVSG